MRKCEMLICLGNIAVNFCLLAAMSALVYAACTGVIPLVWAVSVGTALFVAYVSAEWFALAACCTLRRWQVKNGMSPGDFT